MQHSTRISSIKAWLITGAVSAFIAAFVILVIAYLSDVDTKATIFYVAIYEAVHLVAYLVIGLPFFIYFWPRIKSLVWRICLSLPLGFVMGYLSMLFLACIAYGCNIYQINKGVLAGCMIGGLYGSVTAMVAWSVFRLANKLESIDQIPAE